MWIVQFHRESRRWSMSCSWCLTAILYLGLVFPTHADWPQWGGPNRDFMVDTSGLADKWPDDGPKKLWHRELGPGYSSIVVDGGTLYTMYRKDKKDVHEYTIALDAATGKTIWQNENVAEIPDATPDFGKEFTGPNATPLIVGDRLYTLGRNATLHCFQKGDGRVLWKHELRDDFGAEIAPTGYSCSPMVYGDTIIIPVGKAEGSEREGSSLIAFDYASGKVAWQAQTFRIFHSSPFLIKLDGQVQYVLCTKKGVVGLDPSNGNLLWEYVVPDEGYKGAVTAPVWNGKDILHFSSNAKAYGIKLARSGGKTTATQIWFSKKAPLGMGTPVLIGDMLVGSKHAGGSEIRPLMGVDIRTGKRLWLDRAFAMATPIGDARRLVLLDAEGKLALATANREGLTVHSQCQLTERYSFTAPTLVGTTMYVRDEKHIMALDLSADGSGQKGKP